MSTPEPPIAGPQATPSPGQAPAASPQATPPPGQAPAATEPSPPGAPAATEPVRQAQLRGAPEAPTALALVLLAAVVTAEILAAVVLRPGRQAHRQSAVLAVGGVAQMMRPVPVDPAELARVAGEQHQPVPLAFASLALLDGLALVGGLAVGAPRLRPANATGRSRRLPAFLPSLAVLLGAVAVVVVAIDRLRFLSGLYLSPPYGTLEYLLLYGEFRRGAAIATLALLLALKVASTVVGSRHWLPALRRRPMAGLVLTSMAAMVLTVVSYAAVSSTLGNLADAFAAAVVALAVIFWAGVVVSGSVRRLG